MRAASKSLTHAVQRIAIPHPVSTLVSWQYVYGYVLMNYPPAVGALFGLSCAVVLSMVISGCKAENLLNRARDGAQRMSRFSPFYPTSYLLRHIVKSILGY